MDRIQSMGSCLTLPDAPAPPPPTQPKEKKQQPLQKQIGSKISTCASKLTEIMAWESKIKEIKDM